MGSQTGESTDQRMPGVRQVDSQPIEAVPGVRDGDRRDLDDQRRHEGAEEGEAAGRQASGRRGYEIASSLNSERL